MSSSKPVIARLSVGAAALLLAGQAFAATPQPAANGSKPLTMQSLHQRLSRIERVMGNKVLLDLMQRVESLQAEIRELRGEIESQGFELQELKKRQRDLYLDTDRRLREVEVGAPRKGVAPGNGGSSLAPATGAVSTVTGTTAAVAPATGSAAPVTSSSPAEEKAAYTQAFNYLKEGRYEGAISAFEGFLKRYPDGNYADNAQYWLGEANYVSRRFPEAIAEFKTVLTKFPASPKVSDARLKLGYAHYELSQWEEARMALNGIVADYPNTSVARLATKRLQRMKREGH